MPRTGITVATASLGLFMVSERQPYEPFSSTSNMRLSTTEDSGHVHYQS